MFEERLRRSNPARFAWESQTPDFLTMDILDEERIKKSCIIRCPRRSLAFDDDL